MFRTSVFSIIFFGLSFFLLSNYLNLTNLNKGSEVKTISGPTMGTSYTIKISDNINEKELDYLSKLVEEELHDVNMKMSTYIPESELSTFNASKGNDWFSVSKETLQVVKTALQIFKDSEGAFDVSMGPLVNLWGFGPDLEPLDIPDPIEIKRLRSIKILENLKIRDNPPALKKLNADIYIDLSGIAKGFGVDKIAHVLEENGISNYMVEIGGEIKTAGLKIDEPWKIAIEQPTTGSLERSIFKVLKLRNHAIATSGDYRNFREKNGVRLSHIIDPRTGFPVKNNIASTTVIGTSSMETDAWATAFTVLDKKIVKKIAEKLNMPVMIIEKNGDEYAEWHNQHFEKFL